MTYIDRTWFILAEFNFYWQNITSTGRIWLPLIYTSWLSLLLVEYDLYWQNITSIGRIWWHIGLYWLIVTLTGRICSQSKVFCHSALLCWFNIPLAVVSYLSSPWLNSLFSSLQMTYRSLCFGSVKVHAWQCCSIVVWRVHETRHSGVPRVFLPGWCHSNGSGTTRCHRGNMCTDSHHMR